MDCSIRTSSDVLMFSSTIVVPSSMYYSSNKNQNSNSNSNTNIDVVDNTKPHDSVNGTFDAFPQSGRYFSCITSILLTNYINVINR